MDKYQKFLCALECVNFSHTGQEIVVKHVYSSGYDEYFGFTKGLMAQLKPEAIKIQVDYNFAVQNRLLTWAGFLCLQGDKMHLI